MTAAEVRDLVVAPQRLPTQQVDACRPKPSARPAAEARCHVDNTSIGLNEFCSHIRRARLR